jgi:hypothetical protein
MPILVRKLLLWLECRSMGANCGSITPRLAKKAAVAVAAAAEGVAEGSGTLLVVVLAVALLVVVLAAGAAVLVTEEAVAEAAAVDVAVAAEVLAVPRTPTRGPSRISKDRRRLLMTETNPFLSHKMV